MAKDAKDRRIEELERENAELRAKVEQLMAEIAELRRRLGLNSRNSSKPPSSDGPEAPRKRSGKKGRKRKRGAQKGHEPHLRRPVEKEKVTRLVELEPEVCPDCGGRHFGESSEEPIRNQYIDIPPIELEVLEYRRHVRTCLYCETLAYAPLPDDAPREVFGPGVLAVIGMLTGVLNTSKRKATMIMNEVFNLPISLGGLSNCEEKISRALEPAYNEAKDYVRQQAAAHADETSWRRGNGVKGWLWTLCCTTASVFMVHAKRGKEAARNLLGAFAGILVSDRWSAYNLYTGLRQLCWEHLKRDFCAVSEAVGRLGEIGKQLYDLARLILRLRRRVRDGTLKWHTFQRRMEEIMPRVEKLLRQGAREEGPLAGKCREIWKLREYLWTFVYHQEVEPTNNAAERSVRQGVIWRKTSFGTQSERGARYVERVLTVCGTCHLQGKSVIEFLRQTCHAYAKQQPIPSLIA